MRTLFHRCAEVFQQSWTYPDNPNGPGITRSFPESVCGSINPCLRVSGRRGVRSLPSIALQVTVGNSRGSPCLNRPFGKIKTKYRTKEVRIRQNEASQPAVQGALLGGRSIRADRQT